MEAAKAQFAAALGLPAVTDELLEKYAQANPQAAELYAASQAITAAEAEIAANEAALAEAKAKELKAKARSEKTAKIKEKLSAVSGNDTSHRKHKKR